MKLSDKLFDYRLNHVQRCGPFESHQLRDKSPAMQHFFRYLPFIQKKIALPGLVAAQRAAYRGEKLRHIPRCCPGPFSVMIAIGNTGGNAPCSRTTPDLRNR